MFEHSQCPNCGTSLPSGASYCAKCGYGTQDGKPKRVPFPWALVAVLMFIVPLGTFGACFVWLTTGGKQYSDLQSLNVPIAIESISISIGITMILVNLVTLAFQGKK